MRNIAIITARGGSKRIPNKNIKQFCDRPIIEYSIEAALAAGIFDEVMVSTDSQEIKAIALAAGASVPFLRSKETSDDYATTADVILEVIDNYKNTGREFEYAACIYPTAPFITAEKLKRGMNLLKEKEGNIVMPVVKFAFPPQRCMVCDGDVMQFKWPENLNVRSQDLEPFYHDCGQFYCFDIKNYTLNKGQITKGIVPMIMPEMEVQDIDNIEDWKIAELKYKIMIARDEVK